MNKPNSLVLSSITLFTNNASFDTLAKVNIDSRRETYMKESKFTGTMLGLLGVKILSFIITSFTLGLGYPWAVSYKQKWLIKNQIIDGEQLVFTGTGAGLFGNYIKWFLLTIVTLGIYGLWLPLKIQGWITKNTHKYDEIKDSLEYGQQARLGVDGNLLPRSSSTSMEKANQDIPGDFSILQSSRLYLKITLIIVVLFSIYGIVNLQSDDSFPQMSLLMLVLTQLPTFLIQVVPLIPQLFGTNKPKLMKAIVVIYGLMFLFSLGFFILINPVTSDNQLSPIFYVLINLLLLVFVVLSSKLSRKYEKTI
jgi:hypothetical protein